MTNLMKALILNAVLIVILAGGFVYVNNVQAEPTQAELVTFSDVDFNAFPDSGIGIEVAQNTCGSETCTDNQCCCLNIDSGAQCCRDKVDDNCVESCKKSKPC
jgi:hypothetical protein